MDIEIGINGFFEMNVFYLSGKQVGEHKDEDIKQGILDSLQQGEYVIGMATRSIYDINDLEEVLYTFELEATNALAYEFDEI